MDSIHICILERISHVFCKYEWPVDFVTAIHATLHANHSSAEWFLGWTSFYTRYVVIIKTLSKNLQEKVLYRDGLCSHQTVACRM